MPAYEWQGRCRSFLTVNVAVTQCFHLCSWLSYQISFLVPECFPYELCCVLSLCEWTYSEKHSHCLVLRLPTHSCIFLHFFWFLMPGPEISRDINHRIIERFPHKTGKKKNKIKRWVQLDPTFEIRRILKPGNLGEYISVKELK